ncbi:hypothetical protein N0V83_010381 [Neocucurbitaria cava]|uniref:Calcineurin-like phosphoesterase domain-containing protein n=1 Tax=Neocucurbitaria cava TaxID=798079 RepID=A0A9W8XXQ5_9PLEO|nr:hypothetical protein N0V83_010381 [Neocucurbitaria cava]
MSLFAPQFQILSDLHLETPLSRPQYTTFNINAHANNFFLLGDIGLVKDNGLFIFLKQCLEQNPGARIFYILGNHEPYQTTLNLAVEKLRVFEEEAKLEYGGRFKFLFRNRYDLNQDITILGCTLWSAIQPHQATEVHTRLTDFNKARGIQNWTLEDYSEEHRKDLEWLNAQVLSIQENEPNRQIVIATHHCPTTDPRATDPAHQDSTVGSAFVSELSNEICWTSPAVKLWAFGHTHYSCNFRDEETGKLVVSNQKGYMGLGGHAKRSVRVRVVEADDQAWRVIDFDGKAAQPKETEPIEASMTQDSNNQTSSQHEEDSRRKQQPKLSLFQRTKLVFRPKR